MFQTLPLVASVGALGAVLRHLMVTAIGAPLGTLAVKFLGSLVIGLLFVWVGARQGWQLFPMMGLLGGFTTFSAFVLDTLQLIQSGATLQATAYVAGSVALSLTAVALGVALMKAAL